MTGMATLPVSAGRGAGLPAAGGSGRPARSSVPTCTVQQYRRGQQYWPHLATDRPAAGRVVRSQLDGVAGGGPQVGDDEALLGRPDVVAHHAPGGLGLLSVFNLNTNYC